MREPQGHIADQFVADVMTESIVDVLEVIEVDIEHGRGCAAASNFLDYRFETFAEINAIRETAERVMHGEMTQP